MEIKSKDALNNIFCLKKDNNNFIDFCPRRGGLITNWTCDGEEILYFDTLRFLDNKKSIRGGIPILFPICGDVDSSSSIFGSQYHNLNQHGFARDLNWKFRFNKKKESLNLFLKDNENTRDYFPFSFEINIDVTIQNDSLNFEIEIVNKSNMLMPINFGLHPYFNISNFKNIEFIDYPLICQNQKNNKLQLTSDSLNKVDEGIDLLMYSSGYMSFKDNMFKRIITLINPYPFNISVIWSNPPRKMICLEPWTSPRNSLIDGFRKIIIPSQNSQILKTSIFLKKFKKNQN